MRSAHPVAEVRAAEQVAMAAVPDGALMQRAAAGLAVAVLELLGTAYARRVLLLVGSGNNGGDALYAGALLARRGCAVEAVLLGSDPHPGGVAALTRAGGRTVEVEVARTPEVVVDGIVGIGGRGPLRPDVERVVAAVVGVPVVAVDLPSGVDADSGEITGPHVTAALTVTFGTHKIAHLVDPAARVCGTVQLVDLGLTLPPARVESLEAHDAARLLPRPRATDHKYSRGVVGLRTGSAEYLGAALLSVAGANCGLAGMVRYDGPAGEAVKAAYPEVVGPGRVQAWVTGCGGGREAEAALVACLADGVPVVVDADALLHLPGPAPPGSVLTPHAGELAALLDLKRAEVEAAPLACVRRAAQRLATVVVLKGRRTLIADPAGVVRVNTTGVPWLATAGAGDVLAGLIGALLAAGLAPLDAASVGTWLHGAAATDAAADGPLTASAVAKAIRRVVGELDAAG
jgi:ADP-dependent NAD(P)H-hydrate dehydratase / NAD(P)H-hydrate epimerase